MLKRLISLFLCVLLAVPVCLASMSGSDAAPMPEEQGIQPMMSAPAREYYVSNGGDDNADGETPATAWATLDMLNNTVFQPGDAIYLDATSTWDGQLTLQGSGAEGSPIVLSKYNDGGDSAQRPVINGNGTISTERRWGLGTGPDNITGGAVELINVSYWEISGLELTNLGETAAQRRCGIRVLSDYAAGPEDRTMENYINNKMEHIYIRDCYIHDVNSANQGQQAPGYDGIPVPGAKGGGGIISSGFVDDLLIEGNTVTRCDSEGIRNEACGPDSGSYGGIDANNGYPQAAQVTFRNNYVSKSAGDAFVMSGADGGVMEYNYATLCGKSYLTDMTGSLLPDHGNDAIPQRLGTQSFAALWFVGCANSAAQYNSAVNNSYESAGGGTAWGIDAYCDNVVYQYNYSTGNPGGWYAHQYASTNTVVRYNISVDDGMSPGFNKAHDSFIQLDPLGSTNETDAPRIYNNLLILNLKEDTSFFGRNDDSAHVYFQNNIVYSKNRATVDFIAGRNNTARQIAGGDITNNLFYPAGLFDLAGSAAPEANLSDNLFADPLLVDIEAVPPDVLHNRDNSAVDSTGARDMVFDAAKLAAFRLTSDSPAIDAGIPVAVDTATDQQFPLTKDIFGGTINFNNDLNIGVQQVISTTILTESVTITNIPKDDDGNIVPIVGRSRQLGVIVLPEDAGDKRVTWYVTDVNGNATNLAGITQDGLLSFTGSGTIKIKVVTKDEAACEDSVTVEVVYVDFHLKLTQPSQISLRAGQTYRIGLDTSIPDLNLVYTANPAGFLTIDQTTGVIKCTRAGGLVILVIRSANYPDVPPLTVIITTQS